MNVVVRNVKSTDLHFIKDLLNYEIENGTAIFDYYPKTIAEIESYYEDRINNGFPLILAEVDGRFAGFASYGPFRFKDGYRYTVEHSIYLTQSFQGKGIGSQLLQELIRIAKAHKLKSMIAGIDNSNVQSIEFHKRFGFKEVGKIPSAAHKFDNWLDLVFLQLILE